jgi:hypothetical protein
MNAPSAGREPAGAGRAEGNGRRLAGLLAQAEVILRDTDLLLIPYVVPLEQVRDGGTGAPANQ